MRFDHVLDSWLTPASSFARTRNTLLDAVCTSFALWTVVCQVTVFFRGNAYQLLGALGLLGLAVLGFGIWAVKRFGGRRVAEAVQAPREQGEAVLAGVPASFDGRTPVFLVTAAVLAASYYLEPSPTWFWSSAVAYLVAAACMLDPGTYRIEACPTRRVEEALLMLLALGCAVLTLSAVRSSSDDTFYVNLAVGIADVPHRPILQYNTMVGVPGLELNLPIYKAHTIEALAGIIAWLTPLSALQVAHFLFPALAAALLPLALARTGRLLVGSRWLWCVVFTLAFLAAEGSAYEGYANHAFVRFQHGKSILLAVGIPLLVSYALEFMLRPSWRAFLLLCCADITSTGLTGTAIWLGPVCIGLALLVLWRPTWSSTRTLGWGLASATYNLALGLWLRGEMAGVFHTSGQVRGVRSDVVSGLDSATILISEALSLGFGSYRIQAILMFVLLAAGMASARSSLGRRFAVVFPLAFFVLVFNPLTAAEVRRIVALYARVFWALPLPLCFGLLLAGSTGWFSGRARWWGPAPALLLAAAFIAWAPDVPALSRYNSVRFGWLEPKVDSEFPIAHEINRLATDGGQVLAPEEVSIWLTVEHHHAFPLATKPKYLRTQISMTRDEAKRRELLMRYVAGLDLDLASGIDVRDFERTFERALADYALEVVCLNARGRYREAIRTALSANGFGKVRALGRYEVWQRAKVDGDAS